MSDLKSISMFRIRLTVVLSELSPVYDLRTASLLADFQVELSEAEVADYRRVVAEYEAWQAKIKAMIKKKEEGE